MNNSALFKAAHKLTKSTIKAGDSYSATFGACLKAIKAGFRAIVAKGYIVLCDSFDWVYACTQAARHYEKRTGFITVKTAYENILMYWNGRRLTVA